MRSLLSIGFAAVAAACLAAKPLRGQESVISTVHNLSAFGPGDIRSLSETEVCKFCHVPHNAVSPEALWGHALTVAEYSTPELRRGRPDSRPAPQPDGASRLCLSCHDGTVALGDLAGQAQPTPMRGRERLLPGDRGYLGTDLSGSHPVSFVVEGDERVGLDEDGDMGVRPVDAVRADGDVRLDRQGKMQCTTCHDPHSDRFFVAGKVPRFWVKPSVGEVCAVCHARR